MSLLGSAAGRAALSRLKIAADISGGTTVREFGGASRSQLTGSWFLIRLWRSSARIVDGALIAQNTDAGLAASIEQFMDQANIDVARFSIVPPTQEFPTIPAEERQSRGGAWLGVANLQHRDLILLNMKLEGLLRRLGHRATRNIRRSEKIAAEHRLDFTFLTASRSMAADAEVKALAAQNYPVSVPAKNIATFEAMIGRHGNGFQSSVRMENGALISLCRGFIENRTAHLVYQINNPVIPMMSLSLLHRWKLIEELILRGVSEIVFIPDCNGPLRRISRVTSYEELIAVRSSFRGLAVAAIIAVILRKTRLGGSVKYLLGMIARHWLGKSQTQLIRVRRALSFSPITTWAGATSWLIGLLISCAAVSVGVALRSELLPYISAYPALVLATYLAGRWVGLLTMALGGFGILYFVIPPSDSFALETAQDAWSTVVYFATALPLWRWLSRQPSGPFAAS